MALKNKSKDMTPFDMKQKPCKQNPFLLPLIWGGSFVLTRQFGLRIEKINMEKADGAYLVLGTHQGFSDYYIGPLALFPRRAMYVSDMEGFAGFGKNLYRGIGCIGKRRYVADINVVRHIKNALKDGQPVVLYPEARHSNIGITAPIPGNMGKLVKSMDSPLVVLTAKGSYLANPFWNEEKTRKVPIRARLECLLSREEVRRTDEGRIQKMIEDALTYDEYAYQHEEGFLISDKDRAEGLERALYRCNHCGTKYRMRTKGANLFCASCKSSWLLTKTGWLEDQGGLKCHLPDWYRMQQAEAVKELEEDPKFQRTYTVRVEALPNEKGFVDLGTGELVLDKNNFTLRCRDVHKKEQVLNFPHKIRESVQTEYNYRKKGRCIVLSERDCSYYLYAQDETFEPTEIQFWGERLFDLQRKTDKGR